MDEEIQAMLDERFGTGTPEADADKGTAEGEKDKGSDTPEPEDASSGDEDEDSDESEDDEDEADPEKGGDDEDEQTRQEFEEYKEFWPKIQGFVEGVVAALNGDDERLESVLTALAEKRGKTIPDLLQQFAPQKEEELTPSKPLEEMSGEELSAFMEAKIAKGIKEGLQQRDKQLAPILKEAERKREIEQAIGVAEKAQKAINLNLSKEYAGFQVTTKEIAAAILKNPSLTPEKAVWLEHGKRAVEFGQKAAAPKGGKKAPTLGPTNTKKPAGTVDFAKNPYAAAEQWIDSKQNSKSA